MALISTVDYHDNSVPLKAKYDVFDVNVFDHGDVAVLDESFTILTLLLARFDGSCWGCGLVAKENVGLAVLRKFWCDTDDNTKDDEECSGWSNKEQQEEDEDDVGNGGTSCPAAW